MTTAHVEIRSQHSRGGGNGSFGGPDTYVAVQVVPAGFDPLKTLNRSVAAKRGIKIIHCGEGYSEHQGPRSMYGKALAEARQIADKINGKKDNDD